MPITRNRRRKIAGACAKPSELQTTNTDSYCELLSLTFNPSRQTVKSESARLLFAHGTEIHVGERWYGCHRPISPVSGCRPTVWWHLPYPITHQQKPLSDFEISSTVRRYHEVLPNVLIYKKSEAGNITIDFLTFRGSFAILVSWIVISESRYEIVMQYNKRMNKK